MLIDTHAHIYLEEFESDRADMIDRARTAGVERILMPNIDASTVTDMHAVQDSYPEICCSMMGLHPCSVNENYRQELEIIDGHLDKRDYIAVGEIGTDLYWDKSYWKEQKETFNVQCEWAQSRGLPVVIHCRETLEETIDLVKPFAKRGLRGVFHCFSGSVAQATRIRDMGFFLGIGGVSTFKNGGLIDVMPALGLAQVILETDSPYLTPTPHRGKRNEPAYVKLICAHIAAVLDQSEEEVMQTTTQNTHQLFEIG